MLYYDKWIFKVMASPPPGQPPFGLQGDALTTDLRGGGRGFPRTAASDTAAEKLARELLIIMMALLDGLSYHRGARRYISIQTKGD